ncbi:TPA: hypothetical protein DDW35_07875 [Candidatus Sumerlaeota bacterium]|nr:hypothetical protein [Candidatus Sumerlaeota bacterium]
MGLGTPSGITELVVYSEVAANPYATTWTSLASGSVSGKLYGIDLTASGYPAFDTTSKIGSERWVVVTNIEAPNGNFTWQTTSGNGVATLVNGAPQFYRYNNRTSAAFRFKGVTTGTLQVNCVYSFDQFDSGAKNWSDGLPLSSIPRQSVGKSFTISFSDAGATTQVSDAPAISSMGYSATTTTWCLGPRPADQDVMLHLDKDTIQSTSYLDDISVQEARKQFANKLKWLIQSGYGTEKVAQDALSKANADINVVLAAEKFNHYLCGDGSDLPFDGSRMLAVSPVAQTEMADLVYGAITWASTLNLSDPSDFYMPTADPVWNSATDTFDGPYRNKYKDDDPNHQNAPYNAAYQNAVGGFFASVSGTLKPDGSMDINIELADRYNFHNTSTMVDFLKKWVPYSDAVPFSFSENWLVDLELMGLAHPYDAPGGTVTLHFPNVRDVTPEKVKAAFVDFYKRTHPNCVVDFL